MTAYQILAKLASAAPVGTPVNWRQLLWPNHDTAAIRTLLREECLEARGLRNVAVSQIGAATLRRLRTEARATVPIGGGPIGTPAPPPPPPPSDSPTSTPIRGTPNGGAQ